MRRFSRPIGASRSIGFACACGPLRRPARQSLQSAVASPTNERKAGCAAGRADRIKARAPSRRWPPPPPRVRDERVAQHIADHLDGHARAKLVLEFVDFRDGMKRSLSPAGAARCPRRSRLLRRRRRDALRHARRLVPALEPRGVAGRKGLQVLRRSSRGSDRSPLFLTATLSSGGYCLEAAAAITTPRTRSGKSIAIMRATPVP